jgi:hypothetical protein
MVDLGAHGVLSGMEKGKAVDQPRVAWDARDDSMEHGKRELERIRDQRRIKILEFGSDGVGVPVYEVRRAGHDSPVYCHSDAKGVIVVTVMALLSSL